MSELPFILKRIESGARVRITQNEYGQERVETTGRWLPLKKRISLARGELQQVKDALRERGRSARAIQFMKES